MEGEMTPARACPDDSAGIDPYGFQRSQDFEPYKEMMHEYVSVLERRSERWSKLLQDRPGVEKNLTVKRFVRKGVPNEHRARIWMAASGAQEQLDLNPGHYRALLATEPDARLRETIHTDLHRTFPDNIFFQTRAEPGLQEALFRVLLAYGLHNKAVGYCQELVPVLHEGNNPASFNFLELLTEGMNFIAGYLIIITKDEEQSFWLLDALLGRILPDYYSPAMLGLKADQDVLGELVKAKAPAVGQLMDQYPGIWTLVASRWFICLYIDILPIETVLRVWDCLFYEGSKVLFRVALTLVLHHQAEILRCRSLPDVCECFRQISSGAFTLDCHTFMQRIFTEPGSLSMATIDKLRDKCRRQILEEESR